MWNSFYVLFVAAIFNGFGHGDQLEVTLERPDSGFFIQAPHSLADDRFDKQFVITSPSAGPVSVKAKLGAFVASTAIPSSLLSQVLGNESSLASNLMVNNYDMSAHIVTRTVTKERPRLQVLFHASQFTTTTQSGRSDRSPYDYVGSPRDPTPTMWCMKMHVVKDQQEYTAVCVLSRSSNVCLAEQTLPSEWWHQTQSQNAKVYFNAHSITSNLQCFSTHPEAGPVQRTYVSTVTLTHGEPAYQELKEDQHILIHNPQRSFYPGSKFKVPIKLQAESDLETFVIRVRARHGIRVVGAEACGPDWTVRTDINTKRHSGVVTASVTDPNIYSKTARVQDVFRWIFEVDPRASADVRGRLSFTLQYEMSGKRESYGSIENRVGARIEIQADNTYTIVPIIKVTELVNTAMLTGRVQRLPMRIYSVSQTGNLSNITSLTTCHSGNEDVLKVSQSCNLVYLDGTETSGSSSVSVIAKYGRHTKFLFFKVWVPEIPLSVNLSDDRLSQIKQWKAPRPRQILPSSTRKVRDVVGYGIYSQPNPLQAEHGMREQDFHNTCNLRYQQTRVRVHTRFFLPDDVGRQHLFHRRMRFEVTDIVSHLLRVADTSVAQLIPRHNVVEGRQSGRTEIQVLSEQGRVLGAVEVRVGTDKVEVESIEVDVVSGLDLHVAPHQPSHDMDAGFFTASINLSSKLHYKDQQGLLDVAVCFSDGTRSSLSEISPLDYFLETTTLNDHVVIFNSPTETNIPMFTALGPGSGDLLRISLKLGEACQRKNSRSLADQSVEVHVNFTKPESGGIQNDPSLVYSDSPFTSYVTGKGPRKGGEQRKEGKGDGGASEELDPRDPLVSDNPTQNEAQRQPLMVNQGLTPLEIGMYVLLGVFCLAIVVFFVNCMIFAVRYRSKRKTEKGNEHIYQAADWVWIGRDTLERNAINTTCRQTLMPDADFNGNQHLLPQTSSNRNSSASTGTSSGSLKESNRNSMVSTYKGSECSIRITANPIMDENDNPQSEEQPGPTAPLMPQHPSLPRRTTSRFSGRGLSTIGSSLDSDSLRRRKLAELEEAVASGSEMEFDYEALGMTYQELMEYFDNLKESTA